MRCNVYVFIQGHETLYEFIFLKCIEFHAITSDYRKSVVIIDKEGFSIKERSVDKHFLEKNGKHEVYIYMLSKKRLIILLCHCVNSTFRFCSYSKIRNGR